MTLLPVDPEIARAAADPAAAVELLVKVFGFTEARRLEEDVYELRPYRGGVVFYVPRASAKIATYLATDSRAFFLFGKAGGELPSAVAGRGRSLAQILERRTGATEVTVDHARLAEIAPSRRAAGLRPGGRHGTAAVSAGLAARRGAWLAFARHWNDRTCRTGEVRRPAWKEIALWFETEAPAATRAARWGERTLKRDLARLLDSEGPEASADFIAYWNGTTTSLAAAWALHEKPPAGMMQEAFAAAPLPLPAELPPRGPTGRTLYRPAS